MLFGTEIQRREFSEKLLSSFVVCAGCRSRRGKASEVVSLPVRINVRRPLTVELVPANAAIAGCVVTAQSGVGDLLGSRRKPQIRTAIIQPVPVDMVGCQPIACWEDEAMHVNGTATIPSRSVETMAVLGGVPLVSIHQRQVTAVDNRVLSLRQGDEDTILVHSVLQSLSAAPGAVLAAARNFLNSPNFSMVTRFLAVS